MIGGNKKGQNGKGARRVCCFMGSGDDVICFCACACLSQIRQSVNDTFAQGLRRRPRIIFHSNDHLKSFAGCSAFLVWVTISQLNFWIWATVKVRVRIWSNNAPITSHSILTSSLLCRSVFRVKAPHDCVRFRVKRYDLSSST